MAAFPTREAKFGWFSLTVAGRVPNLSGDDVGRVRPALRTHTERRTMMRGRKFEVAFAILLILAMASPGSAARHSSLSGNLLIQDADDMFFFPQLVSANKRMVTFDFGTDATLGSGGMVFGTEKLTLGMFAHRSDFLSPLESAFLTRGDIDNINSGGTGDLHDFGIGVGPSALNWIDLIAGWQWNENPWGVRLSLGRNNLDPAPDNEQSDVTAFNLVLGSRIESLRADFSAEFAMATASAEAAAGKLETSPWHVGLGVRHMETEESDALTLGWLGMFSYTAGTIDSTPVGNPTRSVDGKELMLVAGAGPVYKPNDRTNVAMYGTFRYEWQKSEGAKSTVTNTYLVIPGWNLAAEVEVASWLQIRGGLRSEFAFADEHNETGPVDTHDKSNELNYAWTSGVGIHFGDFTIDAYLDPSVLTTGTDLLGNSDHVFGMVSTTYRF
jgi:hypothetical protein